LADLSQGSSFVATLGFVPESLWDSPWNFRKALPLERFIPQLARDNVTNLWRFLVRAGFPRGRGKLHPGRVRSPIGFRVEG